MSIIADWYVDRRMSEIQRMGGWIEVDGHPCGGTTELKRALAAAEIGPEVLDMLYRNIISIADVVQTNESLPPMSRPEGYPTGYRPKLLIRSTQDPLCGIEWF